MCSLTLLSDSCYHWRDSMQLSVRLHDALPTICHCQCTASAKLAGVPHHHTVMMGQRLLPVGQTNPLQFCVLMSALLQILGKHGEVLGSVEYAAAIHRPIPSMGQVKAVKTQPGHEKGSTDSTILAVTSQHADLPQHRHFVKQPAKQAFAAGTASMASQDSTALSAFHGGAILAEWNVDVGQPQEMHLGVVSDEEVGRSLSEHEDADSLIPSGSGIPWFTAVLTHKRNLFQENFLAVCFCCHICLCRHGCICQYICLWLIHVTLANISAVAVPSQQHMCGLHSYLTPHLPEAFHMLHRQCQAPNITKPNLIRGAEDGDHQDNPEEQTAPTGDWQQPVAAAYPARTTADSVLDETLRDIADMPVASAAQAEPSSSRRTTVDSVLSTLFRDVADTSPASVESQAPAASSRSLTADSVLYAGLGQTAAPSSALVHHPAGAQPSSTRTTTDSVLDRTLLEMESRSCTVSRQPSEVADTLAAPSDSRRHTADSVVDAVLREVTQPDAAAPQPSTTSASQNGATRGLQSSGHPVAAGHMQDVFDQPGHRPTADAVLVDVLADVEGAEQESVDSLLDGVLNEVVGAASRQRTTADSVLDAMLDDVSASRLLSQEGMPSHSDGHRIDQTPHLQQPVSAHMSAYHIQLL